MLSPCDYTSNRLQLYNNNTPHREPKTTTWAPTLNITYCACCCRSDGSMVALFLIYCICFAYILICTTPHSVKQTRTHFPLSPFFWINSVVYYLAWRLHMWLFYIYVFIFMFLYLPVVVYMLLCRRGSHRKWRPRVSSCIRNAKRQTVVDWLCVAMASSHYKAVENRWLCRALL